MNWWKGQSSSWSSIMCATCYDPDADAFHWSAVKGRGGIWYGHVSSSSLATSRRSLQASSRYWAVMCRQRHVYGERIEWRQLIWCWLGLARKHQCRDLSRWCCWPDAFSPLWLLNSFQQSERALSPLNRVCKGSSSSRKKAVALCSLSVSLME